MEPLLEKADAGLFLIAAVQCAFWARQWYVTPMEILNWRPHFGGLPEAMPDAALGWKVLPVPF